MKVRIPLNIEVSTLSALENYVLSKKVENYFYIDDIHFTSTKKAVDYLIVKIIEDCMESFLKGNL
ncbi:MAG TPA: hypothetical protein ENJ28_01180 [Gammaproteobacteria bacterium]|nr:hypothetical protein [Gammaproteobacteria bacterium]